MLLMFMVINWYLVYHSILLEILTVDLLHPSLNNFELFHYFFFFYCWQINDVFKAGEEAASWHKQSRCWCWKEVPRSPTCLWGSFAFHLFFLSFNEFSHIFVLQDCTFSQVWHEYLSFVDVLYKKLNVNNWSSFADSQGWAKAIFLWPGTCNIILFTHLMCCCFFIIWHFIILCCFSGGCRPVWEGSIRGRGPRGAVWRRIWRQPIWGDV